VSLLACGIGRKDTVIVPATTFVATANAVLYTGAKVRLVDIDSESWCIKKGTYKKRGIIPVCLYGANTTVKFSLRKSFLIWDCAEAIGFSPMGKEHELGNYAIYSLNGNKTMTTGGGGLVVGKKLDKIRELIRPAYSNNLAYNYGMPAHNARLGLEQLKDLDKYLEKKTTFNKIYREELSYLTFQKAEPGPCWMTAVLFPDWVDIENMGFRLEMRGVPTRRVFKPLNHYKHLSDGKVYTNAEYVYKHGLVLPSSTKNDSDQIYDVCKEIKRLI
jgi:dTDP-4-amino-4,6-dideoxygalactose transaminase